MAAREKKPALDVHVSLSSIRTRPGEGDPRPVGLSLQKSEGIAKQALIEKKGLVSLSKQTALSHPGITARFVVGPAHQKDTHPLRGTGPVLAGSFMWRED